MARVLIVEDEPLLREFGAEFLGNAGYEVIEASDAAAALAQLEERDDIDLLFTDIRMPGSMDGMDLAVEVQDRWPDIRLLITSGHIKLSSGELPDGAAFLSKPYLWEELGVRIGLLLGP